MPSLIVRRTGDPSRRVEIAKPRMVIGRSARNDVHVDDVFASRQHAELHRGRDGFSLTDLGSANGTLVNGRRIVGTVPLAPGDRIQIGGTVLELDAPELAPTPRPGVVRAAAVPGATTSSFLSVLKSATAPGDHPTVTPDRRAGLFDVVRNVGSALLSPGTLDEVLQQILDYVFEGVPADRAFVLLREGDGADERPLVCRAASYRRASERGGTIEVSDTIAAEVIGKRHPLLTSDAQQDERLRGHESIVIHGIRSVMAVPLEVGDEVLGMIYVDSPVHINVFRAEDLALLEVIASVAAMKIDHTRLLDERIENERMRAQLASACAIQKRLLPAVPPGVAGYELAGASDPCFEVGGDAYDFIPRADGTLLVSLADVSGKGMDAALLMSSLHAAVRAQAGTGGDVAAIVERVNDYLCDTAPFNRFVTLFLAELDPSSHRLIWSSAGQNPPLVVRGDGEVELLEAIGPPAGITPGQRFPSRSTDLAPGDVLVAISDGVVEATGPDGQELGETRLGDVVRAAIAEGATATTLRERIDAAVAELLAGNPAADDMTVVIARRLPG